MTFALGALAQIIHVTDDLAAARRLYGEVFGGESYYEGYSPFEKRDASIFALGDATIEPMSPSDEPGALDMPVGRFLQRFGASWHSIAINTTGVLALADHLTAAGIRVVGPGGAAVSEMSGDGPVSIYTHPKDTHVLIEFVDFGAPFMPASPRLHGQDAKALAADHPAGVFALSHVTVLVRDLAAATAQFTDLFGCPLVEQSHDGPLRTARLRLGTETIVELCQPAVDDDVDGGGQSEEAEALATSGEGVYSVSLLTVDLDRAERHLASAGVPGERRSPDLLVLDRAACAGARLRLVQAP